MTNNEVIDDIKKHKAFLEHCLKNIIETELNTFQLKTGMQPETVNINMLDVTTLLDPQRRFILGNVEVILPRI